MRPKGEAVATEPRLVGRVLRDWWLLVAGLVIVVMAIVASSMDRGSRSALDDLPADTRAALYSRTMENLRTVCAHPTDDVRSYCTEEASLAVRLPECDDACRSLARPFANRPSR